MFKRTLIVFQSIVLVSASTAFGQADSVQTQLSLKSAMEYAVKNNLSVKNSQLDLQIAKKKIWETTAIGLPQVNGSVNYQHQFSVPEMSFGRGFNKSALAGGTITSDNFDDVFPQTPPLPLGVKDNTTWDITVSQLIFSGEYIVGLRAAQVYKEVSERNLIKSENDIRESVSQSYYLALVVDENVRILKETQVVTNNTLSDVIALGKEGIVEEINVDQVRILKATIDNAVSNLERQAALAKKLLLFQLGYDLSVPVTLTDNLNDIVSSTEFTRYLDLSLTLENNADYNVVKVAEKLQKLNVDRYKTMFLPTISGFYRHQEQLKAAAFNFQPKDVAGITLSLPIFTSGSRLSQLSQAKKEYEKTKNNRLSVERGLNLQFEQSKNTFASSYSSYLTHKENLTLSKKIFDQTMVKYKEGVASSTDLHQAETQLLDTQSKYFTALSELLNAKVSLDKLTSVQN